MKKTRLPSRKKHPSDRENETPKGMRPVGARALKSAIDTLRPWLAGSEVLDLFSGQGRFGISALEEDASFVVFVEKDGRMAAQIKKQTEPANDRREVRVQDVFQYLNAEASAPRKFDIIFADPPFALWNEAFTLKLYSAVAQVAKTGSIFLVKHPRRVVASRAFQGFTHWKSSVFGESQFFYFKYGQTESDATAPAPKGDLPGDV